MQLSEGQTVSCNSKIKVGELGVVNGVIWMITGAHIYVLDTAGYIHECLKNEIYEEQK